jgi:hypothetical protein
MIAFRSQSAALIRRLTARAARLALARTATRVRRGPRAPIDWHSAADLWPDFTGASRDGK